MVNMDDPLDFESEDPLLSSPVINQKRKKVIGLDDLLTDYYKEKSKVIERESKRAKAKKNYNSDEDDNGKEALLSRKINECHNQMREMSGEEEISTWGVQVFGNQKPPPPLVFPELGSCSLLQSFMSNKHHTLIELSTENGDNFLEGLLVNGWLSKLVSAHCHVEKLIAKWTFNLMFIHQKELRTSACDFWWIILSPDNKVNYSSGRGPPNNIRGWIKFTSACCLVRSKQSIFSASEAEELVKFLICLSLDRQLQALLMVCRIPLDLNCLRSVECISGVGQPSVNEFEATKQEMMEIMMKGERMAKRSSFGSMVRKRLSDITNSQPQIKLVSLEEKQPSIPNSTGDLINQLLKELNLGREKLKSLQHELLCKDALLKAKNLEQEFSTFFFLSLDLFMLCFFKEVEANNNTKPGNSISRRATRSQSMGPSTTSRQGQEKEMLENKRILVIRATNIIPRNSCFKYVFSSVQALLRRQSARFKSQERELPMENLFEIEDAKFPIPHQPLDNPMQEDGQQLSGSSVVKEEKFGSENEAQVAARSSLGRPVRRAVEKVQSYKEVPLNTKMRREE
ncbi:hypothetical protein GH714_015109 [Hevea brasiliensis]|uniref:Shugoshin C-terminal domain-containing protein n=1 Tax=Hevea brasiliensis TaxID=3981 RepID=A0A6A6LJL9_HEVBR|nr:hypothetical protein GH714_015109 [Hevea brasiliensis]